MKRHEVIHHLTNKGCIFLREGKKHTVYVNPKNRQSSTIPRHVEIQNALVRKICEDLAIPNPWQRPQGEDS